MLGPGRCLVPVYIDVSIVVSPKMKTLLMVRREPKGGGEMNNTIYTWYTLAIIEGDGYTCLTDEINGEVYEYPTLEEAKKAREEMDCPEGIIILKETRQIIE